MAINPTFAAVPVTAIAQCTTAYTDRSGAAPGLVDLITGGTNGTKVTTITAKVAGNSVGCTVLIFITNTSGTNPRLFDEIPLTNIVAAANTASARNVGLYDDLQLASGQKLQVGCTALSGSIPVNVIASAGDF